MELKIDKQYIDEAVQKAVEELKQNNIWIPEGMTNGEVMQAVFPNIELGETRINRKRYFFKGEAIETFDLKVHDNWWNAPYQKGGE